MKDEIKEIYLSNLEWTKTHDNMGGVMGNIVFKDNISYEEYQKLFKSGYFILCDKDYITNLQEEKEDYKSRCENAVEFTKKESKKCYSNQITDDPQKVIGNFMWHTDKLLNILNGGDKE